MAKRKKQRASGRKNDAVYFRSLNRLVDELFDIAAKQKKWTWDKMADESGLSRETIYKLGARLTKYPQYRTVELLAVALGGSLAHKPIKTSAANARPRWTLKLLTVFNAPRKRKAA